MALSGGGDYELCFTAPLANEKLIEQCAQQLAVPVTRIGCITAGEGVQCFDKQGVDVTPSTVGYRHF